MQRLAVVVPTLDEAEALDHHLPAVAALADEVVVSDGGSRDDTVDVARRHGARVVCGEPGRGPQLNRGAAATSGDLLLFLHADTALPETASGAVHAAIAAGAVGGGFRVRFDAESVVFRCAGALINTRTRLSRAPLGDQGQFVSREAFERLGGFRDWPILEDLDFIRRLRRLGDVVVLPDRVTTSARRYQQCGVARTVALNWLIWSLFLLGASPHRLAGLYRTVR